jgi:hypothetical protein
MDFSLTDEVGFGEKLVANSLHVCNRNSTWGGLIGYIAIPVSQLIPSSVCRFIPRFRSQILPQLTVRRIQYMSHV